MCVDCFMIAVLKDLARALDIPIELLGKEYEKENNREGKSRTEKDRHVNEGICTASKCFL